MKKRQIQNLAGKVSRNGERGELFGPACIRKSERGPGSLGHARCPELSAKMKILGEKKTDSKFGWKSLEK